MKQDKKATTPWNDQRMEIVVGYLLRTGVLLSAAVVVIGGAIYLFRHGAAPANFHVFQGELSPLRTLAGIAHGVLKLSGSAVIQLGLLLLIATPIARVLFSAVAFAFERDYLYVAFTLAVLGVLAYSLLGQGH
jgi:uncharacterized membrane protein